MMMADARRPTHDKKWIIMSSLSSILSTSLSAAYNDYWRTVPNRSSSQNRRDQRSLFLKRNLSGAAAHSPVEKLTLEDETLQQPSTLCGCSDSPTSNSTPGQFRRRMGTSSMKWPQQQQQQQRKTFSPLPLTRSQNQVQLPQRRRNSSSTTLPSEGLSFAWTSTIGSTRKLGLYAQRFLISLVLLRFATYVFWIHTSLVVPDATSSYVASSKRVLVDIPSTLQHYARPRELHQSDLQLALKQDEKREIIQRDQPFPRSTLDTSSLPLYHARIEARRQRTRPRMNLAVAPNTPVMNSWNMTSSSTLEYETMDSLLVASSAEYSPNDRHHDWSHLCQEAALNKNARIILTGIFSHPPAMALALFLAKHCHVEYIMGIDNLFPNRRKERMRYMADYRLLQQRIKQFQLVVPNFALTPGGKSTYLVGFKATHVVHMETALPRRWWLNMEESKQRLFTLQQSLVSLQEILELATSQTASKSLRVIHVTSNDMSWSNRLSPILSTSYYACKAPISFTHLKLPGVVVGPFVPSYQEQFQQPLDASTMAKTPVVFVEDALAAILQALRPSKSIRIMQAAATSEGQRITEEKLMSLQHWLQQAQAYKEGSLNDTRLAQTVAWTMDNETPYRKDKVSFKGADYRDTFGSPTSQWPCSSSCGSSARTCLPSVFDDIQHISQEATQGCEYVVYLNLIYKELNEIVEPKFVQDTLCRVAFVSGKSKLIKGILKEPAFASAGESHNERLAKLNGKIKRKGWKLVWLPYDDETSLSDSDNALLRIDPSRMFAPTVLKAMYAEDFKFAIPGDEMLLRILRQLERRALPKRSIKELRAGTSVSRFVPVPAEKRRSSVIFASEPLGSVLPESISDFVKIAGPRYHFPAKQLQFYTMASHYVQTNIMRPDDEIRSTIYFQFPFQWVSMNLITHDLTMEESRQFRCSWYDEYLFWGGNRNAEELSLAFVLGRKRIEGEIGQSTEEDTSWLPLWEKSDPNIVEENAPEPKRVVGDKGAEVFIRILKNKPRQD